MTKKGQNERTAMVLVEAAADDLDEWFERLDKAPHELTFESNPTHEPTDKVLLGSFGPPRTNGLYPFVGMLHDCTYAGKTKTLRYGRVERFACPVVAWYGDHVQRKDLVGDRQPWGPSEFNYVLAAALTQVPKEAEALSHYVRRR